MSNTTRPRAPRKSRQRKPRDFRAEYAHRKRKGLAAGKTLPQARGHARAGERPKPATPGMINPRAPEEQGVRLISRGATLRAAAKEVKVPEDRLRRYLKENTAARWTGRKWDVADARARQMPMYSEGVFTTAWLSPAEASRAGEFMHAVRPFLKSGDQTLLDRFRGESVRDVYGKFHPFETGEDMLYELDNAGELSFPEYYKIVA